MKKPVKIVFTGAESSGKSTLSQRMASHLGGIWVPEYSRDYIENLQRKYTYADIETIAKYQINYERNLPDNSFIVFDTWLIITKVWFDFVYGKHPDWLHQAIVNSDIELFLLCDIDMPWQADKVRENGGENRKKLHEIYIGELQKYQFNYHIVSGIDEARFQNAKLIIDKFLESR